MLIQTADNVDKFKVNNILHNYYYVICKLKYAMAVYYNENI